MIKDGLIFRQCRRRCAKVASQCGSSFTIAVEGGMVAGKGMGANKATGEINIVPVPITTDELTTPVVLVDAAGLPIGTAPKLDVHRRGTRHLAISVIVANARGQVMLQQRAFGKYHSGGLWTNTCCSHPYPGETVADAATRRLQEEMGFTCPLQPLFATAYRADLPNGLIENEYVHVFGGRFEDDPKPDPSEVQAWSWQSLDDINRQLKAGPGHFTAWFEIYFNNHGESLRQLTAQ